MKARLSFLQGMVWLLGSLFSTFQVRAVDYSSALIAVKSDTERKVHELIDPVLLKHCGNQTLCQFLKIKVQTSLESSLDSQDESVPLDYLPGLENERPAETGRRELEKPQIQSVEVSLLFNSKLQTEADQTQVLQYLKALTGALPFPVDWVIQRSEFPASPAEQKTFLKLRQQVLEDFKKESQEALKKACPEGCLLTDYQVMTTLGKPSDLLSGAAYRESGEVILLLQGAKASLHLDAKIFSEGKTVLQKVASEHSKTQLLKELQLSLSDYAPLQWDLQVHEFLSHPNLQEKIQERAPASVASGESPHEIRANTTETTTKIEKIERVESSDDIKKELQLFKVVGLIFFCALFALLLFIAMTSLKGFFGGTLPSKRPLFLQEKKSDVPPREASELAVNSEDVGETSSPLSKRYAIDQLYEELLAIYSQHPRVAKQVFSRLLNEEGIESVAQCVHIFGESVIFDILRDPSLQGDAHELIEFYVRNEIVLKDEEKFLILKRLKNRTVAAKMTVFGKRSTQAFDFLGEMDAIQILDLIRSEPATVKAIVMTQCDHQKRGLIYAHMESALRMEVLEELPRIDYLPRDYIQSVSLDLKKKKRENPKLNTEALPGSDVLVNLLEKTGQDLQKRVVHTLENQSPDSARHIKSKLVSVDTLLYLRDYQLLDVLLNLKHEELIHFLKGASDEIRQVFGAKAPAELVTEIQEELNSFGDRIFHQEMYDAVERKILNRLKVMIHEGKINLLETNERMFEPEAVFEGEKTQALRQGAEW